MNFLTSLLGILGGGLNSALGLVVSNIQKGFQTAIQFHKEGVAFSREVGLSARQAQAYTNVLIQRTQVLANKYGVSAEAIAQVQRGLSEATGKQLMLNNAQAESFVQIDKLMGAQSRARFTEEIMNGMGGQVDTVSNAMAKVYATAAKQGLNAKKLTDKVAQNLSMANRLSFRNGIDGITRMAALSEKLSINMASVETAAGQFMDLDKAIENAAQMQMLGGSAAANFGNPLTAAYEANYDPEAFAQRMSDSLGSYATFDASKGIASINGMNMDFVRNIAKTMGISVDDATKMAKKQAEVKYKENQFGTTLDAYGLNEDQKNFLINNSQIKNGQMYYTDTSGVEHNISEEGVNKDLLAEMQRVANMSDRDIMIEQSQTLTSIDEHISGATASVTASFAKGIQPYIDDIGKKIQSLGNYFSTYAEQWGADTGKVVGKAMNWINDNGDRIRTVADGILGAITRVMDWLSGGSLYRLLFAVVGYNALKGILGGSMGIGSPAGLARTGARAAFSGVKQIWKKPVDLVRGAFKERKNFRTIKNRAMASYRATTKVQGKSAARGLWNASKNVLKNTKALAPKSLRLLKSGGIGIAGALGNIAIDSAVAKGKIKQGGVAHYAGKMASTAAEYAAFGSMLGPIGTALGGAVGAVKGAYDTWKSLPENADKDFLDYAKSCGDSIVEGGKKAFGWAKEKIGPALSSVNKEIQDRGGYLSVAFNAITAPVRLFINTLQGIAKLIVHPVDTIKSIWDKLTGWLSGDNVLGKLFNKAVNALIGEKHANGGFITSGAIGAEEPINSFGDTAQRGEVILNPTQQRNFMALANDSNVRAKEYGGDKEYIYKPNGSNVSNVNGNTITVKDFNISLNGTLKLDAGNAIKNIDMNALLNDYQFMNALKDMIKDSINADMNGGRFMNDLATRRGQVSSSSIIGR